MLDTNFSLDKNLFLALISQYGLDEKSDYVESLYSQFLNVITNNNVLYKIEVQDYEPSSIFTTKPY